MKQIILFTLIGILLAGGLTLNRQNKVVRLSSELSDLQMAKLTLQQSEIEIAALEAKYASAQTTDVAAFSEALYNCARQTGIRNHEITTKSLPAELRVRSSRSRKNKNDLKTNRLEVAISGSFRQIAEYVDKAQKLSEHKKLSAIELLPGEKKLGATVIIDLYSLEAPHAL
jgi:hypothetical protein